MNVRLQILSDTHLEWHKDGGAGCLKALNPSGVDVLIAAGDIGGFDGERKNNLMHGLHVMCQKYPHVVYVIGNHEFYGVDREALLQAFADFKADGHPNFHLLNDSTVEIDGQRFIGGTMWFLDSPQIATLKQSWEDFHQIPGFIEWWLPAARATQEFLRKELRAGDVVVTHYAPSWASEDPRYAGRPTNNFFVVDVSKLIMQRQPRLWVHGHVHRRFGYSIGETRVLCNPLGYPHFGETGYMDKLVLDLL